MNYYIILITSIAICGTVMWFFWAMKPFSIHLQNALGEPIVITGRGPLTIVGNIVGIPGKKAGLIWQQREKTEKEQLPLP